MQLSPLLVVPPQTSLKGAYIPGATYHCSSRGDPTKHGCLSLECLEDTLCHRTSANASLPPTWQVTELQQAGWMPWPSSIGKERPWQAENQEADAEYLWLPFPNLFPNLAIFFFLHDSPILLILLPNPWDSVVPPNEDGRWLMHATAQLLLVPVVSPFPLKD